MACVSTWLGEVARETKAVNADVAEGAWKRMAASLVSNFFGLCRSKVVKDHGIVNFPKSWADLHRFEGLGRGLFERSWLRLRARGNAWLEF